MSLKKFILGVLFTIAGVAIVLFVGFGTFAYFAIPRETNSLRQYVQLRSDWDEELVGHFPREIPNSASLRKFSHFPGFLQGGAHIQLRLRLPADQIRKLYSEFAAQRTKSFMGGDTNSHMNEKEGMPTTFFQTSDTKDRSFPDDYEIMIFDRVLPESERPPGFYWNHGKSHGVAISTKRSEIVYWAESW